MIDIRDSELCQCKILQTHGPTQPCIALAYDDRPGPESPVAMSSVRGSSVTTTLTGGRRGTIPYHTIPRNSSRSDERALDELEEASRVLARRHGRDLAPVVHQPCAAAATHRRHTRGGDREGQVGTGRCKMEGTRGRAMRWGQQQVSAGRVTGLGRPKKYNTPHARAAAAAPDPH
jgi:hypothetical protein